MFQPSQVAGIFNVDAAQLAAFLVDPFDGGVDPLFHAVQHLGVITMHPMTFVHLCGVEDVRDDHIPRIAIHEQGGSVRRGKGSQERLLGFDIAVCNISALHTLDIGQDGAIGQLAVVFAAVYGRKAGIDERPKLA